MIVKRETVKPFIPVTIVLQSKEELENMWHITNCGTADNLINYCEHKKIDYKNLMHFKDYLWNTMDENKNE